MTAIKHRPRWRTNRVLWAWRLTGWWLHLGPVTIGLRSHKPGHEGRPNFSERYRTRHNCRYLHVGSLCLVLRWRTGGFDPSLVQNGSEVPA